MAKTRIAVIVGSLRKESFNRQLADALPALAPDVEFTQLRIDDLPLYNQDDDGAPAASVKRLKSEILAATGLVFVTPEYNRSMPGVLKNAIDHASRPYGQSAWKGKPAGVLGVSIGAAGTAMAQQHLRNVLAYLDAPTLGQPEVFIHAKEGVFVGPGKLSESTGKFVQGWLQAYLEFVNDLLHGRLPFPQADRIVGIQNCDQQTGQPESRSTADFVGWRGSLHSFDSLGAYRALDRNLITPDGRAEPVRGVEVSAAAFHIAQLPPLLGRTLELTPTRTRRGAGRRSAPRCGPATKRWSVGWRQSPESSRSPTRRACRA